MGAIIHNFNGYVLKYVGDGIISFFPEPDYNGMHDNALYCAYTMKKYIIKFLNPLLKEKNLPELNFRIGINSGEVIKTIVGYNKIKQHFDLIGKTINIAAKVQSIPLDNSILLSQNINPLLHNFWKEKLKEIELSSDWDLKKIDENKDYKVYILDALF
jgi:class 3 adenylate cyclase